MGIAGCGVGSPERGSAGWLLILVGLALAAEAWISQAGCTDLCPHSSLPLSGTSAGRSCYSRGSVKHARRLFVLHTVSCEGEIIPISLMRKLRFGLSKSPMVELRA